MNKLKKHNNVIQVPRFAEDAGFYSTPERSALMRKIRSKNTKAEIQLRKILWKHGFRYRLHTKGLIGKPDIIFVKQKLVVFVDGNFWHGYNWKYRKEKLLSNKEYWIPKIERNMQRDIIITNKLMKDGWKVIRFWDHEIFKDANNCAEKIWKYLDRFIYPSLTT
jgi:DNA mismatch endonuclease (patch repair protein)